MRGPGRHNQGWTAWTQLVDEKCAEQPRPSGRHRANVSSTHVPAYPFTKTLSHVPPRSRERIAEALTDA